MSRLQHILRTITVIGPLLAICSISPALLAAGSGGSAPWVGNTMEGAPCKGTRVPSGPYDYLLRKKYQGPLFTTEEYHLTPTILNLQKDTTTSAINEIQYSLMVWPNHHKALYAAYQYRLKARKKWKQKLNNATPVECHLQRAAKFSPRDPVPHMLRGLLMHDFENYPEALQSFREANRLLPNDVITLYNMGLTLVKLENYKEAMQVAQEVYSTDFPLQGLKNMLVRAGQWNEATTDSPADSDPAEDAVTEVLSAEEEPVEELAPQASVLNESMPTSDERVDTPIVSE